MAGNQRSGRKALPTNVHLLQGNRSKKAASELKDDVKPAVAIPDPPMHLQGESLKEWQRITPLLAKMGLIAECYRNVLALYCDAWADYLEARAARDIEGTFTTSPKSGYRAQSAETIEMRAAAAAMHRYAAEFGLTPTAIRQVTQTSQLDMFNDNDGQAKKEGASRFF